MEFIVYKKRSCKGISWSNPDGHVCDQIGKEQTDGTNIRFLPLLSLAKKNKDIDEVGTKFK